MGMVHFYPLTSVLLQYGLSQRLHREFRISVHQNLLMFCLWRYTEKLPYCFFEYVRRSNIWKFKFTYAMWVVSPCRVVPTVLQLPQMQPGL